MKRTHGLTRNNGKRTPEYQAYAGAKHRCTNPNSKNFKHYGARGIRFLFTSFEQFFAELGPRPNGLELDRVDNDGHYEPGNVRWATSSQQKLNRRKFPHVGWTKEMRKSVVNSSGQPACVGLERSL
jgi:hypothetical protein